MNDFRKYATQHLGMNGLVFDEVMKAQAHYMNPYILEERQLNVTQMDVYSRLMMDRIIFLGSEVDDYAANTLQAQLLYLDSVDSGKDISIYINSPGGSVTAGLGIYDTMQFISSDVATICTGMAASMAAVLLVAGAEGKRSALPHSRVMIHQPLGGVQGQASDIEIEAKEIQKFKKELYTIISNHSHTPYEKLLIQPPLPVIRINCLTHGAVQKQQLLGLVVAQTQLLHDHAGTSIHQFLIGQLHVDHAVAFHTP